MAKTLQRETQRASRHRRIRKRVAGSGERLRLCVHRSLKNFYAQLIDDASAKVVLGLSTLNKEVSSQLKNGSNVEAAKKLGHAIAEIAKQKGVQKVVFDRGGYKYHGRVKAFAEAARESGLEF